MKKIVIYTTIGTLLVVSGILFTTSINAQELDTSSNPFFQKIAEKLGVDESEFVGVVEEIRDEMKTEREAERAEIITKALEDGTLTEKQGEILNVLEDLKPSEKPEDIEEWKDYTQEQREALRESRQEARQSEVLNSLSEAGLEVTQDEIDELHTIMEELDLGVKERGMGMRMHR
jgi:hypothetical protein